MTPIDSLSAVDVPSARCVAQLLDACNSNLPLIDAQIDHASVDRHCLLWMLLRARALGAMANMRTFDRALLALLSRGATLESTPPWVARTDSVLMQHVAAMANDLVRLRRDQVRGFK